MPTFPISQSLALRTLEVNDVPELYGCLNDNREHLQQWLPRLVENIEVDDLKRFIESSLEQEKNGMGFRCGMFKDGALVGICGYHPINRTNNSVVIGYWLAERMQGQGIATSCVRFLVSYAFENLNINKICISMAEGNVASRAIPERLNFVNEGIDREADFLHGRYVNYVRYSMLYDEWNRLA